MIQNRLTLQNWPGYVQLTRLNRPVGIYLLLWPTLWALIIAAEGIPNLAVLTVFVLGVVIMRSAGCVINDYADRHVDGAVKRTKERPLVSGQVDEKEALQLFFVLIACAFLLVLTLSWSTILMSVIALVLAASYPFMKRYTYLPQVVLGAAFGWAIPMAFVAIQGDVPVWGWLLFVANLCWTVAYDTFYAMVDRDDDIIIGVKSTAILFGQHDRLIIGFLQVLTLAFLGAVAWFIDASWLVYAAIAISGGLFVHQQIRVKDRDRDACFTAFLDNHYVGMVLTAGYLGHYLLFA